MREPVPRDFYLTKAVAKDHGYTRGCAGCNSWFRGLGRAPHTEACRERFRVLLKDDAKVKNAEARKREFEEREADRKKKKEEKKEWKRVREEERVEDEVERRVKARELGIQKEGGYAQVGGSSPSGTQGVKRKAEGAGDEERESDDRPRGGGIDVDQVTVELASEWLAEIKVEVRRKLEAEEEVEKGSGRKGVGRCQ